MENTFQVIDLATWKRAVHFSVFRGAAQPQYCISFELDVTDFYKLVKEKQWSFTFAMVYLVTKCANQIPEFRYRFREGEVVLYDNIDTAFTYLNQETELFKVVNVPMRSTMEEYVKLAAATEAAQEEYFTGPMPNDCYQFSPLPFIPFQYVSHTDFGKKDQAVPMFDWGKFQIRAGRKILPFSVQVHHSFVDGVHIGKLVTILEEALLHI